MHVVVEKVNITQQEAESTALIIEGMAVNALDSSSANQGISSASQQQLEQFGLLDSTTETLFATLRESGTKVDTTSAIGDDLRAVTNRLNDIMRGFIFTKGNVIKPVAQEKRRAPRAQNSLLVGVNQAGNTQEGVSSDFSLTGMCLRLPQAVDRNAPLDLFLYLPSDDMQNYVKQEPMKIQARIIWQRSDAGKHICGVAFINTDESKRFRIKKCFEFFKKNPEF